MIAFWGVNEPELVEWESAAIILSEGPEDLALGN
jgi:hypothetical protein